jgi:hypothetical protein
MDGRTALLLASAAALPLACGTTPPPQETTLPPQYPTVAAPTTAPVAPRPATPPTAAPSLTATVAPPPGPPSLGQVLMDPRALAQLLASSGNLVNPNLTQPTAVPDALEAGLKGQQLRLAPGMTPEGPMLKQTLQRGQHTTMQVPLQSGKCYLIIGWSAPGDVKDLDLYLLSPPFYNALTAQDATSHNAPFVGADNVIPPHPICQVWPVPLQYKLDVFARDGSGAVVVQVYSKPSS